MTGEMNEINRTIGALKASIDYLTAAWGEQDRKATESRRELYCKFEELKTDVTRMIGRVDQLASEVAKIDPAVSAFEAARNQSKGARAIMKLIWGALIAGIGGVAYIINEWIHMIWSSQRH